MEEQDNRAVYGSVKELASEIELSLANTYRALNENIIPNIRIGKRFIIPRAAVQEWLRSAGKKSA